MDQIPTVIPRFRKQAVEVKVAEAKNPAELLAANFQLQAQERHIETASITGNVVSGKYVFDIEHFVDGIFTTLDFDDEKIQQFVTAYINSAVMHKIIPPYSESIAEYLCILAKIKNAKDPLSKFVKSAGFNLLVLDETVNQIKYLDVDGFETIVLAHKDSFYPASYAEFANREWYVSLCVAGIEDLNEARGMMPNH